MLGPRAVVRPRRLSLQTGRVLGGGRLLLDGRHYGELGLELGGGRDDDARGDGVELVRGEAIAEVRELEVLREEFLHPLLELGDLALLAELRLVLVEVLVEWLRLLYQLGLLSEPVDTGFEDYAGICQGKYVSFEIS